MNIAKQALFALMLSGSMAANAGDGSTLLNHWVKGPSNTSWIYITNISDAPITVTVDLFDQNGNTYNEDSETGDDIMIDSFSGDPTNGGGTLLPKQSGYVLITKGNSIRYGSGVIHWTSDGDARVAATAYGYRSYTTNGIVGHAAVNINNGEPF